MTNKYIEISKEAADASGSTAVCYSVAGVNPENLYLPIYEDKLLVHDNGACAELAVKYRINILHDHLHVATNYRGLFVVADHNNDRMLATNYAILSAVIEISKTRGLG